MNFRLLASPLLITGGLVLAVGGFVSLNNDATPVRHSHNAFAVQGSAYGKLLARLSETTIDRVWHLGVEQVVPHYMSGIEHEEDHSSPKEAGQPAPAAATKASLEKPRTPLQNGKRWFQNRVIAQHHRTNPNGLTDRHLATVYRDIEEMLLRSFKLDPTHYGAYDSYHLFLTTHDFGGNPMANAQAVKVAQFAMAAAYQETEDPEPWLTAAAAGMNLYLMDAAPYTKKNETIPIEIVKEYREKIGYCLAKFDEVQQMAEANGNWDRLSTERQMEIAERSLFSKRTFQQFDAMIARAEPSSGPADPNGAVVKSEDSDDKP